MMPICTILTSAEYIWIINFYIVYLNFIIREINQNFSHGEKQNIAFCLEKLYTQLEYVDVYR